MAGTLLLLLRDEEEAFWLLRAIVDELAPARSYSKSMSGAQVRHAVSYRRLISCSLCFDSTQLTRVVICVHVCVRLWLLRCVHACTDCLCRCFVARRTNACSKSCLHGGSPASRARWRRRASP